MFGTSTDFWVVTGSSSTGSPANDRNGHRSVPYCWWLESTWKHIDISYTVYHGCLNTGFHGFFLSAYNALQVTHVPCRGLSRNKTCRRVLAKNNCFKEPWSTVSLCLTVLYCAFVFFLEDARASVGLSKYGEASFIQESKCLKQMWCFLTWDKKWHLKNTYQFIHTWYICIYTLYYSIDIILHIIPQRPQWLIPSKQLQAYAHSQRVGNPNTHLQEPVRGIVNPSITFSILYTVYTI